MTKGQAAQLVAILMAAYSSGAKVSDETVLLYEDMILDLEFEVTKAAILRLVQTARFLPTIAEVRAAARTAASGPKRAGLEAWGDVVHEIRHTGSYRIPKFADPLVEHVVACMGWLELCLGDNESALRARFVEAYESVSDRTATEAAIAAPLRLQGQELRRLGPPEAASPPAGHLRGAAPIGDLVKAEAPAEPPAAKEPKSA